MESEDKNLENQQPQEANQTKMEVFSSRKKIKFNKIKEDKNDIDRKCDQDKSATNANSDQNEVDLEGKNSSKIKVIDAQDGGKLKSEGENCNNIFESKWSRQIDDKWRTFWRKYGRIWE